jgi:hypothetical protein
MVNGRKLMRVKFMKYAVRISAEQITASAMTIATDSLVIYQPDFAQQ